MRSTCRRGRRRDRGRRVVGGDERAGDPAVVVADVRQPDGDDLADLAPEVRRGAQRPLDPGAGDLQRVVTRHRVVVVELARDQAAGQGEVVEHDAGRRAGRGVERDAQRAAALLDVVQLEPEVGGDRERRARGRGRARGSRSSVSRSISPPFTKRGVGRSPRLSVARNSYQQNGRRAYRLATRAGAARRRRPPPIRSLRRRPTAAGRGPRRRASPRGTGPTRTTSAAPWPAAAGRRA